ncbi:MAG: TonB-dependent receptor plug domain-containing protein, partial [Massilia sp.]
MKTSVVAVALTLTASHIALAQDTAGQPMARVTVTGSNIKRVQSDGTSAIQTITAADIRASGANSVQELLQKVPSLGAGASFDSTDGGFSRGAATASLRGLGPASTLVLLNGRRLTPSAYADPNNGKSTAYDLNNIPLSAIERVEVFKDGASAVYGSDAIAGVINFITRQDYQGAELSASYGANDNNKFQNKRANGVFGFGNLDTDRYNGFVSVDVSQRQSVLIKDVNDIEKAEYAAINYRLNPFSSNLSSSPFFYRERGAGLNSYANSLALGSQVINKLNCDPSRQIVGDPNTMNIATTSALNGRKFCNFNLNDYNEAQSAGKDASILSRVNFQLSQNVQAFGEFAATRSERTYIAAPRSTQGTAGSTVFLLNGAPQQFQLVLPVGAPDNPFPGARSAVGIRFEGRDAGQKNVNDTYRGLVGLKGTTAGWDWESGLLWNRNERTENYIGMLYRPTLQKVNNGTETLDQLLADPTATRDLTNRGYSQVTQIDAKASTEFGHLGGG